MTDGATPDRRSFLSGRAALKAARDRVQSAAEASNGEWEAAEPPNTALLSVSRSAMACEFEALFNASQRSQALAAAERGLDTVDALEAQLSVFRESSELSKVNREAAAGPVRVEAGLFRLLQFALQLSEQTDGAFDVTASPLWKAWGFSRRSGRVPTEAELAAARECVGWRRVRLDEDSQTVSFARSGIELNLGSVGKGFALDRFAGELDSEGVSSYLLHGGQSSVRAAGGRSTASGSVRGWAVGVSHPLHPERRVAELRLENASLGTSGSSRQFFYHRGRRFGHVIDPRTGWPAEEVLAATVVADSACEADAVSTACFVLGPEGTEKLCAGRKNVGVLLVLPGAAPGAIELVSYGMDGVSWHAE